ncbi:MAG: putative nucleotide-diphospho-sugar transferase [Rhabdochlamydiaceae bacterium]|nr:putative nucleotide-diphospho-sugar transferase [Candidatus Amphrikana amoebophyrae]
MTTPFIVVSFYTRDTLYEKEIQNLIASCKNLDLKYDIIDLPNLGDWNSNCHMKPPFILDRLKKHQCPILWLDADSVIHQKPILFEQTQDHFMVRMREDVDFDHFDKVISSTLYVKPTPEGFNIMRKWCEESTLYKDKYCDQECLKNALQRHDLTQIAKPIPINYCKIEGLDPKCDNMVIQQFQASRLLKKIINKEVSEFAFLEDLSPQDMQKIRFSIDESPSSH